LDSLQTVEELFLGNGQVHARLIDVSFFQKCIRIKACE
jgi:hypothetical protein